ncbi:thyrotropin-releasing hormone receptor-like [Brachionus plicatilis]|uniref:Thyrotropin-releasing hormone receptor-like n=1 Tax=Brachionus plicatilis TaxID=10195 RepID=A0A3M7S903_BRAPC|nr:thyrotropin-releasing hormone receptor-like [Brachionus plicatilis]
MAIYNTTKSVRLMIAIIHLIEPYYIFFIVIVGFFGNTVSILVFTFSKFRFEQVNIILAALAFADNGFLASLLVVYLSRIGINLFDKFQIICKLNVFFGYVFSFLSTWYVVLFSIERLIAVYFPIKRFEICNSNRNKLAVLLLSIFGTSFYSYSFVTSDLEVYKNKTFCIVKEEWFDLVNYMAFADIFLSMIIPFFLISISNIFIVIKLMRFRNPCQKGESTNFRNTFRIDFSSNSNCENRNQVTMTSEIERNPVTINYSVLSDNFRFNSVRRKTSFVILRNSDKRKRKKSYTKTTRLLMIVSTTFLALHMPMVLTKITNFFNPEIDEYESNATYTTLNDSLNTFNNKTELNLHVL